MSVREEATIHRASTWFMELRKDAMATMLLNGLQSKAGQPGKPVWSETRGWSPRSGKLSANVLLSGESCGLL